MRLALAYTIECETLKTHLPAMNNNENILPSMDSMEKWNSFKWDMRARTDLYIRFYIARADQNKIPLIDAYLAMMNLYKAEHHT